MTLIKVRAITKARVNKVAEDKKRYKVYTSVAPEKNKANKAIVNLLAKYLKIKPSLISIISGQHSKDKTVQIDP